MRQILFVISAILAAAGAGMAIFGIVGQELKSAAVGMVLIFTAGVFATLYLGSRPKAE